MNKIELTVRIAESADINKKAANQALSAFMGAVTDTLKEGGKVTISGFGTFSVGQRAARTGRNPQTGEQLLIPAKKVVKFNPGKKLAEAVE